MTAKGVPIEGKRGPYCYPREEPPFPMGGVPLAATGLRFLKTEPHGGMGYRFCMTPSEPRFQAPEFNYSPPDPPHAMIYSSYIEDCAD
jgi:hypothetical protein